MRIPALLMVWAWGMVGAGAAPGPVLRIPAAAEYSAACGEISLLVWQGGRVVYGRGAGRGMPPTRVFSITKSLVALGVFRDIQRGRMTLSQPALHPAARGVPLADLLNQTSGLPAARREFYGTGLRDKDAVLGRLRRNGSAGCFVYGPSHWEVLAEEVRKGSGGKVSSWLRHCVPGAGADVLTRWRKDDGGAFFFSTGARMNAFELLPAGRAVVKGLGRGEWPHEVRTAFGRGSDANPMYALGFWLNRGAGAGAREIEVEASIGKDHPPAFWRDGCLSRVAPEDLVAMIGTHGQRVYVVPSRDLVVIRLGTGAGFSDAGFLRRLFGA